MKNKLEIGQMLTLMLNDSITVSKIINHDLELITRQQIYTNDKEISESFPDSWFLFFRRHCTHPVEIKIRNKYFKLDEKSAFFLPPYSLVHWRIPAGTFEWCAYRSYCPIDSPLINTPLVVPWNNSISFTNSIDILDFLKSAKIQSLIFSQEFTNSNLAREAKYLISKKFRENILLSDISDQLSTTTTNLSHIFTSCYGISPIVFRNQLRLQHAVVQLGIDGLSVTDSCFSSGFEDFSRFYRNFKSLFGVAPSQFLQKNLLLNKEVYEGEYK